MVTETWSLSSLCEGSLAQDLAGQGVGRSKSARLSEWVWLDYNIPHLHPAQHWSLFTAAWFLECLEPSAQE